MTREAGESRSLAAATTEVALAVMRAGLGLMAAAAPPAKSRGRAMQRLGNVGQRPARKSRIERRMPWKRITVSEPVHRALHADRAYRHDAVGAAA